MFQLNESVYSYDCSNSELDEMGIEVLTGEACGLSMRLLCDISPDAKHIIEDCLSVTLNTRAWNHGDDWRSMMLPRGTIQDLFTYWLCTQYQIVCKCSRERGGIVWYCMDADTWESEQAKPFYRECRIFHASGTARGGMRNRHEMSGRVE